MTSARAGSAIRPADIARAVTARHAHVRLCDVDGHHVVLAVNEVPFPWHTHPGTDELLLVLEGRLQVETEGGACVEIGPGEAYLVPDGTVHRTSPQGGRCANLVFSSRDAETRFAEDG